MDDKCIKEYLARRTHLLQNKQLPSQDEVMKNLGNELGKTILNTLTPKAKELMGVAKPLSTAPDNLWISPTDHLEGDIRLKPMPNTKCVKSMTHEFVMKVGEEMVTKLKNETNALIAQALEENTKFEKYYYIVLPRILHKILILF